MTKIISIISLLLFFSLSFGQTEFHVTIDGKPSGNGTVDSPWDLQTALSQKSNVVKSGDVIWIHGGIYKGRFISFLNSSISNKKIKVSAVGNERVILNGNIKSNNQSVLEVRGKNVIYKDFDVTFLGKFNRNENEAGFQKVDGVNHKLGEDCLFINIQIYDNPGSGFGSWKETGGSEILDCLIYNNGFISKAGRGSGVGIYVQNNSNYVRNINNNVIFNNYYKGIEVWSANKNANESYVQNISLKNNAVFNNGSPAGAFKDNLIIGTDDRNGINISRNIIVEKNVFYHNTNVEIGEIGGDAASLTIGFNANAGVENVHLMQNLIIGRNNSFRILHAKDLTVQNNVSYCGYVHLDASVLDHIKNWHFKENIYYTKRAKAFRILKNEDYTIQEWNESFLIDHDSKWLSNKHFINNIRPAIVQFHDKKERFKVTIFDMLGNDAIIDFTNVDIPKGVSYKIVDYENPQVIMKKGVVPENRQIQFSMSTNNLQLPSNNLKAIKTLSNFGVYYIEFEENFNSHTN